MALSRWKASSTEAVKGMLLPESSTVVSRLHYAPESVQTLRLGRSASQKSSAKPFQARHGIFGSLHTMPTTLEFPWIPNGTNKSQWWLGSRTEDWYIAAWYPVPTVEPGNHWRMRAVFLYERCEEPDPIKRSKPFFPRVSVRQTRFNGIDTDSWHSNIPASKQNAASYARPLVLSSCPWQTIDVSKPLLHRTKKMSTFAESVPPILWPAAACESTGCSHTTIETRSLVPLESHRRRCSSRSWLLCVQNAFAL